MSTRACRFAAVVQSAMVGLCDFVVVFKQAYVGFLTDMVVQSVFDYFTFDAVAYSAIFQLPDVLGECRVITFLF